ncbi:MAG TPA: hypothetical protein DCZ48_12475 [Methylococcaceae bacterium]|nr:hypothetical protein [Methylococcaceae bacterium]
MKPENLPKSSDCETRLSELIRNPTQRNRCIDRVAEHLDDILAARQQKITWDAIAAALEMPRCTLINAVKTLRQRAQNQVLVQRISPVDRTATSEPVASTPSTHAVVKPAADTMNGITVLGRARREKFNF